ncbi:MAG: CDP-alcohol phosphatidyltransferase family protein [Candidatus Thorarchaeota archaeon]|nr:CDP-alcohol phosphatidyltransferase family protein [Candidatus Thorarchaeota archaeon]
MPSKYRVRGIFRGLVYRVAKPLQERNIRPNSVSFLTLFLALLASLFLLVLRSEPIFGIFVFLVGFFDGVDGAIAKSAGISSKAGALTDSVIDKTSEVMLITGISLAYGGQEFLSLPVPIWALLCISGWLLTSYTRSRAESLGVSDLDVGLGARSERLLTLVAFSLLSLLLWGLLVVTLMGMLTAAYRFHHYMKELTSQMESNHYT